MINGGLTNDVPGTGDLEANPGFTDRADGDYTLTPTSAAIGNGTASTSATDTYGNPTSAGPTSDIGAVASTSQPSYGASVVSDGSFEYQTAITGTSSPGYKVGSLAYGVDHGGAIQQNVAV